MFRRVTEELMSLEAGESTVKHPHGRKDVAEFPANVDMCTFSKKSRRFLYGGINRQML